MDKFEDRVFAEILFLAIILGFSDDFNFDTKLDYMKDE